jgi:hypothetical protein
MLDRPTPLFSRSELAAAFALLMPSGPAEQLAERWFTEFAGDRTEESGWYLHPHSWNEHAEQAPHRSSRPNRDESETKSQDEALFAPFTPADVEGLLFRLGDTHLALVALLNDETFERMRNVRGMTAAGAERNRKQLKRAVAAWRRRWLTEDGGAWRK